MARSDIKFREPVSKERVFRSATRWAKVTHRARGKWTVARGYDGEFSTKDVLTGPNATWAHIVAKNWAHNR